MAENSSSGATQELYDEKLPDQRLTRRQAAYSLTAVIAALVVAAFGFVFAYQIIADGDSSHVHAAESGSQSHEDGAINDEAMELTSLVEMQEGPTHDDDAEHDPHEEASDDHGHGTNE